MTPIQSTQYVRCKHDEEGNVTEITHLLYDQKSGEYVPSRTDVVKLKR